MTIKSIKGCIGCGICVGGIPVKEASSPRTFSGKNLHLLCNQAFKKKSILQDILFFNIIHFLGRKRMTSMKDGHLILILDLFHKNREIKCHNFTDATYIP